MHTSEPGISARNGLLSTSPKHESGQAKVWPLFLLFAVLLLPFCFLGYGPDNDTYSVLDAGRSTWSAHLLRYSRAPGYWAFEAVVFFLNSVGGFLATNCVTLAVALVTASRFFRASVRMGIAFPRVLTACLLAVPVYAVAATTTIDYAWSLLGLVVLIEALMEDRWGLAVAGASWSYLMRSANGVVVAGIIAGAVYAISRRDGWRSNRIAKVVGVGVVAAVVGSLPLLLSYKVVHSLSFLQAMTDPTVWSVKMRVGRFGYKCLMLFGLPASLWLIGGRFLLRRSDAETTTSAHSARAQSLPMLVGGTIANGLLFLEYPLEISYLLPAAAFVLLLVGAWMSGRSKVFAVGFLLLILSANFVTVQLARPDVANDASSASFSPGLVAGQFVKATRERLALRRCSTRACWGLTNPEPQQVRLRREAVAKAARK